MTDQDKSIEKLEKVGFEIYHRSASHMFVTMLRKINSFTNIQAQIDEDGSVNGITVEEFLKDYAGII